MITKCRLIFLAGMLALLSLIVISSCRKEPIPGDPPKLPPSETFLMNYINFSNPDDTLLLKSNSGSFGDTPTFNNWGYAYNTVSTWKTIADFPIALLTAGYLEALKIEPIYIANNTFGWAFSFIYMGNGYIASLVGNWISNLDFKIEMYVSKPGLYGFNSFKWIEGYIRYDWTFATWTVYESPENPVRLLRIDWNKNWDTNTGDIKYTYMKRDPIPSGSSIQFKINNSFYYNASYIVSTSGNKVLIEWNTASKDGHINDPLKYRDIGQWHCWNKFLQDAVCE